MTNLQAAEDVKVRLKSYFSCGSPDPEIGIITCVTPTTTTRVLTIIC